MIFPFSFSLHFTRGNFPLAASASLLPTPLIRARLPTPWRASPGLALFACSGIWSSRRWLRGKFSLPLPLPPTGADRASGRGESFCLFAPQGSEALLAKSTEYTCSPVGAHVRCRRQCVNAPFGIFSSEKANAAELDRWGCVAQPPSCHEEPRSQKEKKGRRIPPPASLRFASPPSGGKLPLT